MKTYKILILEDDFEAVSKIMAKLYALEGSFPSIDFDVTVLSSSESVVKLVNPQDAEAYDVILLDKECKLGGSFHILDIEKFGANKIIAISTTSAWNEEVNSRGVTRVVPKVFNDMDVFARKLMIEIREVLTGNNPTQNHTRRSSSS